MVQDSAVAADEVRAASEHVQLKEGAAAALAALEETVGGLQCRNENLASRIDADVYHPALRSIEDLTVAGPSLLL